MFSRRHFLQSLIASAAIVRSNGGLLSSRAFAAVQTKIPVLLYHRVGDSEGPLTITPDKFASDLAGLRNRGFETISLETFRRHQGDPETPLPEKPIMISFDDGYLDNYLNAVPLLRQYGLTASFFIITSLVGTEDRLATGHIREMSANGMSIGSHTVSHRELGAMGIEEAANELSLSRYFLEGMLQKPVEFIAYPKGSFNESTGTVARQTGYAGGFSILPGTCSRESNPYILKRIPVFRFDGEIEQTMARRAQVFI